MTMPGVAEPHAPIEVVVVIGAGAMGAMYADHFARAGTRTLLLAHGERAERLRRNPLLVNGRRLGAEVVDPLDDVATEDDVPTADLVIVAVKHHRLAEAAALLRSVVTPTTTVLSILNGLDSEDVIRAAVPELTPEQVPLCIALAMDAEREDHRVRFTQSGRLVFGPAGPVDTHGAAPADSPRLRAVQDALTRAGLAWETPPDMRHRMWWKFMVNVGVNQASAVLRAPYGAFQHAGPARDLMMALIEEVRAVAGAEGVDLDDSDLEQWDRVLAGQPVDGMTSMHQDVLAGRETEVGIFAGRVVALGGEHRIPTPHNQTMLWILEALTDLRNG
ncbi:2-dehydropantoate 2-reductase [Nostocoides sp. F2B08]|uniref:ketopantoate reductase family protein n=1 Tax=Nostocoides sp. F2B08 TaxID=2653936 RepID=UPI0012636381|nr:2-dehydropantoate 2-reductase [Tetrasphaera sp. F2B08]KAB7744104.1 2-dehydropantoate 2-reductase [Tetrasphaera sp. F2B08]